MQTDVELISFAIALRIHPIRRQPNLKKYAKPTYGRHMNDTNQMLTEIKFEAAFASREYVFDKRPLRTTNASKRLASQNYWKFTRHRLGSCRTVSAGDEVAHILRDRAEGTVKINRVMGAKNIRRIRGGVL